ncbi:GAF domain-containing protein [Actinokineospora baliensis]|uniref:GAF and ANTAR domain-containing protein n=1 Tax=Actinokineospora baliensis TaxID=547056 RepID=UPI00195779EC|nr:GAF and ANTAR domain-containing protein [Actinokineospora baliensis]MBM7775353.1 GAF domain-containing protein [Actinokineospora baliensis]
MATRAPLVDVLIEMAVAQAGDVALPPYLGQLARRCAEFAAADLVGVLLADGDRTLLSADPLPGDERYSDLFDRQCETGPAAVAFRTGTESSGPVSAWPGFAGDTGFRRAHGIPLRVGATTIGAICLYRVADRPFSGEEVAAVRAIADVAAVRVDTERALRRQRLLAEQLESALQSRVVIEQAKGVLAERRGFAPPSAFQELRSLARAHNLKIAQVAEEVVRSAERTRLAARG